ncbi:hypothetical protein [Thiocapsa bogorovii]|uniref:hypothetical protein n=1 Tax=Thiocapsa bogorovii TaxID=521689 RepID=UPI001E476925|nr:hypothetical protein [Thiocapsa bogorovii]UHD16234.1 hypothetical protein LT988_23810 [Thiocapsa bogorovii]
MPSLLSSCCKRVKATRRISAGFSRASGSPRACPLVHPDAAGDPAADHSLAHLQPAARHGHATTGVVFGEAKGYTFMASVKLPWARLWRGTPDPLTDGRLLLVLDDSINPQTGTTVFACQRSFGHAAKTNQSRFPWAQTIVTLGLLEVIHGRWFFLPLAFAFYPSCPPWRAKRRRVIAGRDGRECGDRARIGIEALRRFLLNIGPERMAGDLVRRSPLQQRAPGPYRSRNRHSVFGPTDYFRRNSFFPLPSRRLQHIFQRGIMSRPRQLLIVAFRPFR